MASAAPQSAPLPFEAEPVIVVSDLNFPVGIAFAGDRMFITERPGRIRVVEGGRLIEEPLAEIPTTTVGEAGLLGIAVPPGDADPAV